MKEENWPAVLKVSVVVVKGSGQTISVIQKCSGYGIYKGKGSAPKKKLRGFPHVFYI
jgi:hypothetical protein